jgi:hypothetical protein
MPDEDVWKARFHQLMLVRLASLAVFIAGIAISFSDVVQQGGSPRLGGIMVIAGALGSLLAPKLLKRGWKQP